MLISRKLGALLLGVILLGGCSSSQTKHSEIHNMDMSMEPIKVELFWSPDEIVVNEKVTFKAVVTQEDMPVDDAKAVLFEIVNTEDKGQKLEIKGELVGEGTYQAEGTFEKEGQYMVTSHVTARTMHSMPSKELSVKP
jgi:hypothetical protein